MRKTIYEMEKYKQEWNGYAVCLYVAGDTQEIRFIKENGDTWQEVFNKLWDSEHIDKDYFNENYIIINEDEEDVIELTDGISDDEWKDILERCGQGYYKSLVKLSDDSKEIV